MQCPAKKFDYKLTKRTVTDLFFRLKCLMYSDHSTFYSDVLNEFSLDYKRPLISP